MRYRDIFGNVYSVETWLGISHTVEMDAAYECDALTSISKSYKRKHNAEAALERFAKRHNLEPVKEKP